jgi:hypothetical protein
VGLAQVYGVGIKGGGAVSDRELLELAAKAAGILPLPDGKELDAAPDGGLMICGGGEVKYWNPLTDDGDALRLAVKCEMSLDLFDDLIRVGYTLPDESLRPADRTADVVESPKADPCAATRRAIVRAAAEIGRNMP